MEMHCTIARLTVIHTHVNTDVIAQCLKENIVGAPPTFIKVKIGLRSLPAARISEFPKVGLGMIDSAGTWIRLSV